MRHKWLTVFDYYLFKLIFSFILFPWKGDAVQKTWDKLVDEYKIENYQQRNKPSGSDPIPVKFQYYYRLSFLKPLVERPPVLSSFDMADFSKKTKKVNHVWQKKFSNNTNNSGPSAPSKVPKIDNFAVENLQKKNTLQSLRSTVTQLAKDASKALDKSVPKASTETNDESSDYRILFSQKLVKLQELCCDDGDEETEEDCFDEILEKISDFKNM